MHNPPVERSFIQLYANVPETGCSEQDLEDDARRYLSALADGELRGVDRRQRESCCIIWRPARSGRLAGRRGPASPGRLPISRGGGHCALRSPEAADPRPGSWRASSRLSHHQRNRAQRRSDIARCVHGTSGPRPPPHWSFWPWVCGWAGRFMGNRPRATGRWPPLWLPTSRIYTSTALAPRPAQRAIPAGTGGPSGIAQKISWPVGAMAGPELDRL